MCWGRKVVPAAVAHFMALTLVELVVMSSPQAWLLLCEELRLAAGLQLPPFLHTWARRRNDDAGQQLGAIEIARYECTVHRI